jgi:hypothetical protein
MIKIKFICKDEHQRDYLMTNLHESLVGSPAYVDSSIALTNTYANGFDLVVGDSSAHNIAITVDSKDIMVKRKKIRWNNIRL